MALGNKKLFLTINWYLFFFCVATFTFINFVLSIIFPTYIFLAQFTKILLFLSLTIATLGILASLQLIIRNLNANMHISHHVSDVLNKSLEDLEKISHDVKLSEQVKSIAYRDIDRLAIGEAILSRLHQKDFKTTYEMIEEIENKTDYAKLAEKLRAAADKYKNASDGERIEQVVSHIENLAKKLHWDQAAAQAEKLALQHPDSQRLVQLPAMIRKMKEKKKTELLKEWEEATNSSDTERSLSVLKELDKYLTPSEGQALQESVSGVFRAKLQNLGVRFSLAVSQENWKTALETGEEIISDYPNSKMAREILSKIEVLQKRVNN